MSDKRRYSLFPKALGDCVEPLTRPVFKERGLASARLVTGWAQIVGASLAEHCLPEKLSFPIGTKTGGTLTIAVENGFATEIQHMQPFILEKLAAYFGYRAVARIAISHSFTPVEAKVKKSTATVNGNIIITENIEDPELKAALESLAKTLSGKGA
jgi:hypothetical protein